MADDVHSTPSDEKLTAILKTLDNISEIMRFSTLGDDRVFSFNHGGRTVKLYLPDALNDVIQKAVLEQGGFTHVKHMSKLHKQGVRLNDAVIYDIGANIGTHSVFFSMFGGAKKVFSFEPQQHCADIFEKNILLNDIDNVSLSRLALSDFNGSMEVLDFRQANHGATRFTQSEGGDFIACRLDDLVQENDMPMPDFMKIDAEGNGPHVLRGASRVLSEAKPIVQIELWPRMGEYEPGMQIMKEHGYELACKIPWADYLFVHPENPL